MRSEKKLEDLAQEVLDGGLFKRHMIPESRQELLARMVEVLRDVQQKVWEECVDAICPLCRDFGWPINNENGEVFHIHDSCEGTKPCLAEALNKIPSRIALAGKAGRS